jgi:hypothetical protein
MPPTSLNATVNDALAFFSCPVVNISTGSCVFRPADSSKDALKGSRPRSKIEQVATQSFACEIENGYDGLL